MEVIFRIRSMRNYQREPIDVTDGSFQQLWTFLLNFIIVIRFSHKCAATPGISPEADFKNKQVVWVPCSQVTFNKIVLV